MIMLPLGLVSWLAMGLLVAIPASRLLPGSPRLGALPAAAVGLIAAAAGGLLATVLGFGGLASFDVRSLAIATMMAILAVTWARTASLAT